MYEDASLGGRLVDFYADMTHLPRQGILEYSAQILASLLQDLENQGFQNAIGSAVSELLKDPQSKSIALSITPKAPVPGVVILATALGSPERLPDLLGAQVRTVPRANPARAAEADPQPKAGGGTASAAGAAAGKAAGDAAAGGTGGTIGAAMEKQGKAATGEARRKVP